MDTAAQCLLTLSNPEGCPVLCLKHSGNFLFAGLRDGTLMVYGRHHSGTNYIMLDVSLYTVMKFAFKSYVAIKCTWKGLTCELLPSYHEFQLEMKYWSSQTKQSKNYYYFFFFTLGSLLIHWNGQAHSNVLIWISESFPTDNYMPMWTKLISCNILWLI